jgi:hypothetical protein
MIDRKTIFLAVLTGIFFLNCTRTIVREPSISSDSSIDDIFTQLSTPTTNDDAAGIEGHTGLSGQLDDLILLLEKLDRIKALIQTMPADNLTHNPNCTCSGCDCAGLCGK